MTLGTALLSSLLALAHVNSQLAYLAVWAFLGLGMRLCLYDAAFAPRIGPRIAWPDKGAVGLGRLLPSTEAA